MGNRIVAFSASPRRNGNSDILAGRLLEGAEAAGATVEKVRLHGLDIRPCTACESCQKDPGAACIQNDDMHGLIGKVRAADGLVLASPIYFFTVNAQMKLFPDRLYALFGGGVFDVIKGKRAAVALSYGDPDPLGSGAVNALHMFQDACRFVGIELCGCVHASCAQAGDVLNKPDILEKAFELGRALASAR